MPSSHSDIKCNCLLPCHWSSDRLDFGSFESDCNCLQIIQSSTLAYPCLSISRNQLNLPETVSSDPASVCSQVGVGSESSFVSC
eukprot:3934605-Rhodomonas_salina.1